MMLYLLRHAEAEAHAISDSARRLTAKGEQQAGRTGKFCRKHGIRPAVILSSPVTRALQTAKIVAEVLDDAEVIEAPWAACGMDPCSAADELESCAKLPSVMLVGHQPDLGDLAAMLLGIGNAAALRVRKSLLCAMEADMRSRSAALEFFVPAKLMD